MPDLPEPRPPDDRQRSSTEPTGYADNGPVWDNEPYPVLPETGRPPPEPPPANTNDNDEPPF
jgi:hypothetical protein